MRAAEKITKELNVPLKIIEIDCSSVGIGEMVNRDSVDISPTREWWPFRNQMLITLASMEAIQLGIKEIHLGVVKNDNNYRDCTSGFYKLMNSVLRYQEGKIKLVTPAIGIQSQELIEKSKIPISLLAWSHSCTRSNHACGKCKSCLKNREIMNFLENKTGNN